MIVNLLKFLINVSTDKDSIILDFFSGSGTTSQALHEMNLEEDAQRKIIQIQFEFFCSQFQKKIVLN